MQIKLRDYQLASHAGMIECFKQHEKVLLHIQAGGGKSITAGSFIAKYEKHFKFVVVVRKRDLVEQFASDALELFGLDYSIFMAGHEKLDLKKKIQVCSKDTMQSRDTLPFEGEDDVILMIDECDEFKDFQREVLIPRYFVSKRAFYFGMTASPFNQLNHFDKVIAPITAKELRARKILVDFIYYIPKKIDFTNMVVVDGAFKTSEVSKKLDHPKAIAESFAAWLQHGENRQTLVFAIDKNHGKRVANYINDYYNREVAAYCDADTPKEKRKEAISKFKMGEYLFLINIDLFTRGTNIVEIGCILDLQITLRVNRHIQKLGRGSRKNDIYQDCIYIDVANNLINNGHFYEDREVDLNSDYKKTKKQIMEMSEIRVCDFCFRAGEAKDFGSRNVCPYCGKSNAPVKITKKTKYQEKKIFMQSASEEQVEQVKIINEFKKVLWKYQNLGSVRYRNDMAREKAHFDLLKKYGIKKVSKVRKTIQLKDETIATYKRRYEYKPLGGM